MTDIVVNGLGKVKIKGDVPTPEESFAIQTALKDKFDFPELQSELRKSTEIMVRGFPESPKSKRASSLLDALNFPRSVKGKVTALKELNPDLTFGLSPEGAVFVNMEEGSFYINKPGLSDQDATELAVETIFQAPLIALGTYLGGPIGGRVGQVAGASIGGASGSLARDVVSGDDLDAYNAAISAGFAGTFEAFAPLAIAAMQRVVSSSRYFQGNQLTEEGKAYLKNIGIDPESITDDFIKEFNSNLSKAQSAKEAARVAEAESLPVKVPLSQGDVTRTVQAQALESAAERGALGEAASTKAAAFRDGQQQALKQNADEIQSIVGTGDDLAQGQGMASVQDELINQSETLRLSISAAYEKAAELKTSVLVEGVSNLNSFIQSSLKNYNPRTAPKTIGLVKDLNKFTGENIKAINVKALENWRQSMSALTRSADPIEKKAAGQAIKAYDDYFDQFIDEALLRGDKGAIDIFKEARGLRKEFAKKFESDRLVADIIRTSDGELILTPNEALNKLFTVSSLGTKQGSTKALKQIKSLVDNNAWQAIKEEAFLRLLQSQSKGSIRNGDLERLFSGDKFASAVDDALKNSKELMEVLYTKKEIQLINQFKNVALSATNRVAGSVNHSGTTTIERLLGNAGFLGTATRSILRKISETNAEIKVIQSLNNPFKSIEVLPGTGGALSIPASEMQKQEKTQ